MTLPTIDQARSWRGLTLVATDNEPVGRIEAIYVDRTTRQPEWALVLTGLFGSARTFVPLADAAQRGDIVRVPHHTSVVREAPRLEQDAELSEEDEARLYAHYGIQYTTDESSSGLPVGVPASPDRGTPTAATDATTELPPASSRLQADAPAAAAVASGTSQMVTAPTTVTALGGDDAGGGRRKQAAAAGMGTAALAAIAAGLAVLRRRRRQPPSLGERVGQAGREAADALAQAAEEVRRQAVAVTSGEGARRAVKSTRKTSRQAAKAGQETIDTALRAAQVALASGLAAAEGSRRAARKAAKAGQDATGSSRRAAKRARKEAVAAAASVEATVESRRRARKRARARKKAAAATAAATTAAARSVAAAPAAAGRRVQKVDAGKRTQKVTPKRRRRSKMKGMGRLGMIVGAAVGYVLGAKAGRERYDQITASARQLLDKPQVKRVVESAPGDLGARLEQVANKAADKVHEAGDKVAATGSGTTGATAGATTTTTTPSSATTTTPSAPSTSAGATTTGTESGAATTTGTGKRSASERKPKSS
jgi:PRC-barrel domain